MGPAFSETAVLDCPSPLSEKRKKTTHHLEWMNAKSVRQIWFCYPRFYELMVHALQSNCSYLSNLLLSSVVTSTLTFLQVD